MASTSSTAAPLTAKVKLYNAMYTTHVHKKQKVFHDGFVRLHHANSKLYLFNLEMAELGSTFYEPARRGGTSRLDAGFELKDGEELFMEGFLIEVGGLCFESETDLSALHSAVKEARTKAAGEAFAWAKSFDTSTSFASPRTTTPRSDAKGKAREVAMATTPTVKKPTSTYKGFGIPPPKSYTGGKVASKPLTPRPSTPYVTPLRASLPVLAPSTLDRPSPLPLRTSSLSAPSKKTSSPFKPPSFIRKPGAP